MSERTFRSVVAVVLVGALILAMVVAFRLLQPPVPGPTPTPSASAASSTTPAVTTTPTPTHGVAFGDVGVTPVGSILRGGASGTTLALRFVELTVDAIPNAPGSFTLTLADSAHAGTTLAFSGLPVFDAPDSLGASAELVAANELRINVRGADRLNIEPITLTGLGISATADAALGPITATLGSFTGSLAGGVANAVLTSPGTIVAGQ